MSKTSDLIPAGNFTANQGVELVKVYFPLIDLNGFHAAADIYADHAGNYLIDNRHGSADGAALSSMNIRHDAYTGIPKCFLIANCLNLSCRSGLKYGREAFCSIEDTGYFYHRNHSNLKKMRRMNAGDIPPHSAHSLSQ